MWPNSICDKSEQVYGPSNHKAIVGGVWADSHSQTDEQ